MTYAKHGVNGIGRRSNSDRDPALGLRSQAKGARKLAKHEPHLQAFYITLAERCEAGAAEIIALRKRLETYRKWHYPDLLGGHETNDQG